MPRITAARITFRSALVLEAREEGLLLRGKPDKRLTWEETYQGGGARA